MPPLLTRGKLGLKSSSIREMCAALFVAASLIPLSKPAGAQVPVRLLRPVWGCVDPNEAGPINDASNPARLDPQWVARTAQIGQCVMLGAVGQWASLSDEYNGLTYIGHRGDGGPIGSFWVPTTALVMQVKPRASAIAAPKLVAPPSASEPSIIVAKRATDIAPPPQPRSLPAPSVVAVPESTTTPPTASAASSQNGGGGGTIWVVLGFLGAAVLYWRSKRRQKSTKRSPHKIKGEQAARMPKGFEFRIHPSSLSNRPIPAALDETRAATPLSGLMGRMASAISTSGTVAAPPSAPRITWHQPGTSVSIAGHTVPDGMVYVGAASGGYSQHDGCVIDPRLPIGDPSAAEPLGYYPSYEGISPHCRKRYLDWLGSGKHASDIEIGYVFLYFYGLERRLILETPPPAEAEALLLELQRLRSLYGGNRSLKGCIDRLMDAVAFLRDAGNHGGTPFIPDLAAAGGQMPPALKLAIAREVAAGQPLGFDLAAAALMGMREFGARYRQVLQHAREPFLQLLKTRFAKAFPSGFLVRNRKNSHFAASYRGAAAGLYCDLADRAGLEGLPDPETLTWTKLLTLGEAAADELIPLATLHDHYPARANSLAALVDCPVELRGSMAVDARRWIDGLPVPAPVPFGLLARHAIGAKGAKWTVRHRRQVGETLGALGFSMEPGADDVIDRLTDDTIVFVIPAAKDAPSREMTVASAAAMLVANIAKMNPCHGTTIEEVWLSQLPSRSALPGSSIARLRARLAWYRSSAVTMPQMKRLLGTATPEELELCAWSATIATGAIGAVGTPQIAALEAMYDALGVARSTLYTGLHAGMAGAVSGVDEPVEVSGEWAEVIHRIPPPPAIKPSGPDGERLAQIRAETANVSAMLASIFTEAEPEPEPMPPTTSGPLRDLDSDHAKLLTRLVTQPEWPRQEFDAIVASLSLMPDGALEAINEWAFDQYGDALIEDSDPLVLNLDMLAEDLAAITAGH